MPTEDHGCDEGPHVAVVEAAAGGIREKVDPDTGNDERTHAESVHAVPHGHDRHDRREHGRQRHDERGARRRRVLQADGLRGESAREEQREHHAGPQFADRKALAQFHEWRKDDRREREPHRHEKQRRADVKNFLDDDKAHAPHGCRTDEQQVGATLRHARSCRYRPVAESLTRAMSSGVPAATTRPPCAPAPGPKSITQSARLMTSRLCSITTTLWPPSTTRSRTRHTTRTSSR